MQSTDTIAALASATGQSGVAVVRVSGPLSADIARAIAGKLPKPRYAELRPFLDEDHNLIDEGLLIFFPGPNSFTGEDVVEFQGHGGMVVQDLLLKTIIHHGARMARPGEFSERAFLNDKVDLTQAEAIADLIAASSEQAARCAVRSLKGEFANQVHILSKRLIELRMYVEAAIDFPDEEIDFLSDGKVATMLSHIQTELASLQNNAKQGSLLRDGIHVVIAGRPNAGKSSLLNALSGDELAIVTDIPGTTRDVLRQQIVIDGLPMHIIDTAGLRDTDDVVEKEGVKRAWQALDNADCIVLVEDMTAKDNEALESLYQQLHREHGERIPLLIVKNKTDLKPDQRFENTEEIMFISAQKNTGISELKQRLKNIAGFVDYQEGQIIARRRHVEALKGTEQHFVEAMIQLQQYNAGELVAEELRLAHKSLGEITGEFTSDDLLGEIFSSFCIGK